VLDIADHKSSNYKDGVIKSLITWQDNMELEVASGGDVTVEPASGGGDLELQCYSCRRPTAPASL
jgi:hypothetical protein